MRRRADVSSVVAVTSLAGDVTTLDSVCLYLVLTDRWSDGRRVRRHERSFDGRWSRRMDAVLAVTWLHKHIAPGGRARRTARRLLSALVCQSTWRNAVERGVAI